MQTPPTPQPSNKVRLLLAIALGSGAGLIAGLLISAAVLFLLLVRVPAAPQQGEGPRPTVPEEPFPSPTTSPEISPSPPSASPTPLLLLTPTATPQPPIQVTLPASPPAPPPTPTEPLEVVTPTTTPTPAPLDFTTPELVEWSVDPEKGEWRGVLAFTPSGGDGTYRYYRDVVSPETEFFDARLEFVWARCKPAILTIIVQSAGQEKRWKGFIPYPNPDECQ